jgi:hypothetical protein
MLFAMILCCGNGIVTLGLTEQGQSAWGFYCLGYDCGIVALGLADQG